jgi:hypothetical protein
MTAFVVYDTFAQRCESEIPVADQWQIEAFLDDACALVEDIVDDTYTTATVPAVTVAVVCSAVRRAYDNPGGLLTETMGDYTWRVSAASPGVYFTPAEERRIRRAARKLGVGSITLSSPFPATESTTLTSTF